MVIKDREGYLEIDPEMENLDRERVERSLLRSRNPLSGALGAGGGLPWLVVGGGVLVLLVLFLGLRGGGEAERTAALEARFQELESMIRQVDAGSVEREAVASLQREVEAISARFERLEASFNKRFDHLTGQIEKAPVRPVAPAPAVSSPAAPPPAAPKVEGRVHTVQPGDTLYGVARKYRMTVLDLRKLNGLSAGDVIRPGQKLKVSG